MRRAMIFAIRLLNRRSIISMHYRAGPSARRMPYQRRHGMLGVDENVI